jgi:hypothetical protein
MHPTHRHGVQSLNATSGHIDQPSPWKGRPPDVTSRVTPRRAVSDVAGFIKQLSSLALPGTDGLLDYVILITSFLCKPPQGRE